MSTSLAKLISGAATPGIYRWASRRQPVSIAAELLRAGWQCFHIDGAVVRDKASFLQVSAQSMQFPAYAARNWDAFEECISDLSWCPAQGYVLLFDSPATFVHADPDAWDTAYTILESAQAAWSQRQVPFFVLLRHAGNALQPIAWLE